MTADRCRLQQSVALQLMWAVVDRGALRVVVQQTFPFDDVVAAHRALDAGRLRGKLALTV